MTTPGKQQPRGPTPKGTTSEAKRRVWDVLHGRSITFLTVSFVVIYQVGVILTVQNSFLREMSEQATTWGSDNGIPTNRGRHTSMGEKVIDILQIGSNLQPELMHAQQNSFASHVSVRHTFNVTEDDDADQLCNSQLTNNMSYEIGGFCRGIVWNTTTHSMMRYMRNNHASEPWLQKKKNPAGWMCAQRRPLHGLYKVLQAYRNNGIELPDHLIIMDDDTYYNMEELLKQYVDDTPELPLVRAGCLVRMPMPYVNLTFPFGGYGTIFNRASLQVMMKPIHCPHDAEVCTRIEDSQIGEQPLFQDGMAIIDLIQAYASHQPYMDYGTDKWTTGYCLHSDWAMGYFINYYNVSRHSPGLPEVPHDRFEEWLGSQIYKNAEGNCKNEAQSSHCQPDSLVCHYMKEEQMMNFTMIAKSQYPDRFRNARAINRV